MPLPLLQVTNLIHRFANGTLAVNDVNWVIEQGQFIVLSGSNGSGKTALVRHFNGLLLPTSGSVLLNGVPVQKQLLAARQAVGMVFQDSGSQMVAQTVWDEIAFGPENLYLSPSEISSRVQEALAWVGLQGFENRHPFELSGGEQRRLAIAGILVMRPKMVVFDEPFNGLDYPGVVQTLQQMVRLHQNNHTILVITHDLEKVLAHATRLTLMQNGQLVADGTPEAVLPQTPQFGVKRPYPVNRPIDSLTWLTN
ncbi:ABC transporter ATP-binding protein [Sphingobacteriales bacterium UPWRP_1]|nr:ABC transporter ATP-binding protein [Sphingobacteriales bacterium TSM_CSS]PSJ76966.1 ABC transporter ATP-binding protein [Sphingobacteriales bacterium UPWRP_1]